MKPKPADAVKKTHYTRLLKAFIDGSAGGLARIELQRLDLVKYAVGGWMLTERGKLRAERLGYLKGTDDA